MTAKRTEITIPQACTWSTRVSRSRGAPVLVLYHDNLQTMDSEPGSPMSSSGSASPVEEQTIDPSRFSSSRELPSYVNSGKRPLPGSSSFMYGSSTKNRRREDSFPRRTMGGPSVVYPEMRENPSGPRPQRDELLDMSVVEQTRRGMSRILFNGAVTILRLSDWGDPFDDSAVKSTS